jgi:hypothetical protein
MERDSQQGANLAGPGGSEGTLDAADARSFAAAAAPLFPLGGAPGRLGMEPAELATFRADMFPHSGSGGATFRLYVFISRGKNVKC